MLCAGAPAVLAVSADASTAAGNKAMIEAAMEKFGEVHGLFANAGKTMSLQFDAVFFTASSFILVAILLNETSTLLRIRVSP